MELLGSKVHNTILENGLLGIDNDIKKSDRLEKYYKFMREYIDDERYKELITGFGKKEILGMWDKIPTSPIYSTAEDELNYN